MSIKTKIKAVSATAASLWLVAGGLVGFAPFASAFSTTEGSLSSDKTCEFSLQLQNSQQLRSQYMAKVIELTGGTGLAENDVEKMYGNVKKASYTAGNTASDEEESSNLWGFTLKKSSSSVGLDPLSIDCLNCHDGLAAAAVKTVVRNDPFRQGIRVDSFGGDHPIGMNYDSYVSASAGYKPVFPGSNKMLFVNGKVGCLTCHDPLNPEKGHLAMSDRESALCRTCHNK